jgi:hypothetical protein
MSKKNKLCNYKGCDVCNLEGKQRTFYLLGEMIGLILYRDKDLLDCSRGKHALQHVADYWEKEGGLMCAAVVNYLRKNGYLKEQP